MYTAYSAPHSVYIALYSVYSALYSVYNIQCTLIQQRTAYSVLIKPQRAVYVPSAVQYDSYSYYVNSKAPSARSDVSFVLLGEAVPRGSQSLSPTHPQLRKRDAGNRLLNNQSKTASAIFSACNDSIKLYLLQYLSYLNLELGLVRKMQHWS